MAEIFGAVAGAISITALFNECIDCFDYVQIARNFGQDFSRFQLRLDVARCRLSRWGAAVNVNSNSRFMNSDESTVVLTQEILQEIVARFEAAQKVSRRYKAKAEDASMEICTETDLSSTSQRLHNRFTTRTLGRQSRVGLLKKTSWALYDKDYMARMIEDIVTSINELEKVFPAAPQEINQLARMEVEELNDEKELDMLQDVTKGLDPILEVMAKHRLQELTGKNSAGRISGNGRVNIGHTFVKESFVHAQGLRDNTVNHVDEIDGGEMSRVNVGNTYGGTGFWH